jgi:CRISPR-associated endonuclease/helicase Cas3
MEDKKQVFYAHSKDGTATSQWQLLEDHLKNTADQAAEFAGEFSAAEWGRIAGLWHDFGK